MKTISQATDPLDSRLEALDNLYRQMTGVPSKRDDITNAFLLDAITGHDLGQIDLSAIKQFVESHGYIVDSIRTNYNRRYLFTQSAILVVYYLAKNRPDQTKLQWPYTQDELRPIYTDLGLAFG